MPITKDTPGVEIELFCESENMPIEGNASAIGPEEDAETNAWIRAQLDSGNEWAWCVVHVRVTYRDIVSDQYLGGCSYRSEKEFRDCEMPTMVSEAIGEINAALAARVCAIRWIVPALGDIPTPDTNPAVVMIQCDDAVSSKGPIPCCADHLARMPRNWRVVSIVPGGYDATAPQTPGERSSAALTIATDQLTSLKLADLKNLRARVEEWIDLEVSGRRRRASRR